MEKLMNKREVAAAFGVTVKAVDKWVSMKLVPFIKISRKCVRFSPYEIKKFLKERKVKSTGRNSLRTTKAGKQ
jgi:predicted DNA-binding transcriptional regulator AlpA